MSKFSSNWIKYCEAYHNMTLQHESILTDPKYAEVLKKVGISFAS